MSDASSHNECTPKINGAIRGKKCVHYASKYGIYVFVSDMNNESCTETATFKLVYTPDRPQRVLNWLMMLSMIREIAIQTEFHLL